MVQWLSVHAPNAGGLGSVPGQGTRSHTLQQGVLMLHLKMKGLVCCNQDPAQPKKIFLMDHHCSSWNTSLYMHMEVPLHSFSFPSFNGCIEKKVTFFCDLLLLFSWTLL